jgi:hypothetical protein
VLYHLLTVKNLSPWALLLLVACSTASNEGADSTQVAIDTVAADFIEQADYSKDIDTTYTEIIRQSGFGAPQIDKLRAYVYSTDGLEVFETADGTGSLGRIEYRSALSLDQPLVNNTPSDTVIMDRLRGHLVEISFNGKQGYVFSGSLLNIPVPDEDEGMVDYFVKNLHLLQPAERYTHECDCDAMRSESTYQFESGINVHMGSYYESYDNYAEFEVGVTIQEVFLLARVLLSHFSEQFPSYPTGASKVDNENGGGIEVITEGSRITGIVVVTGDGCYEEESVRTTEDGKVRLIATGGC